MAHELIVVKQLPVIEEQLRTVSAEIQQQVDEALALAVTEETVKVVKKKRAELNKLFNDLEARRKAVKNAIMAPYEAFEDVYKKYVTDICKPADAKLKKKIAEVENGIKQQKYDEVNRYFLEYCESKGVDFITFQDTGISITMSDSMKSLKERSAAFVDRVVEDLALIETQEHKAEILVEYKSSLNVAQAITTVSARHQAIEEERRRQEELERERMRQLEAQSKVESVVEEAPTPMAPPEENIIEAPSEKVYSTSFRVLGTLEQLKALKSFLEEGGYVYEQLG